MRNYRGYTVFRNDHGVGLFVSPKDYVDRCNSTRYHLRALDEEHNFRLMVPVIYIERTTLFADELWPFSLDDLPYTAASVTKVVARSHLDICELVKHGYTKYAADKIVGN